MKPILLICVFLIIGTSKLLPQVQIGDDLYGPEGILLFGQNISFSGDGKILAITKSPTQDISGVFLYKEVANEWVPFREDGTNRYFEEFKIHELSLAGDGKTLAFTSNGVIHVYTLNGNTWEPKGMPFGMVSKITLSWDGNTIVIAEPCGSSPSRLSVPPPCGGVVQVFRYQAGGWSQIGQSLSAEPGENYFGIDTALSIDAMVLAVASTSQTSTFNFKDDIWTQTGSINYGNRVSLSGDGKTVVAVTESLNTIEEVVSSVAVFNYDADNWYQIGNDIEIERFSGLDVSLSSEGHVLAIGTIIRITDYSDAFERALIFQFSDGDWQLKGNTMDGEPNDGVPYYVEIELSAAGDRVVISNSEKDIITNQQGYVRVFDISNIIVNEDDDGTLGVESTSLSKIKIYPNPTSNNLELVLPSGIELKHMNIYSLLGKKVMTTKTTQINLSFLSQGSYYAEIITNKGSSYKKLIVN